MYYFHIFTNISSTRGQGVGHKVWASYLFRNLNDGLGSIVIHKAASQDEIEQCIAKMGNVSYTTEFDVSRFKPGTTFKSFHYQSQFPVSNQGLIVGFLIL